MEMKPWDVLRKPVKKNPLEPGVFRTTESHMTMRLVCVRPTNFEVQFGSDYTGVSQAGHREDAMQLSEFFKELADQLEG